MRVWDFLIFGSNFGILDMSSWLYIQFFTRNPNLQSEFTNSFTHRRKLRKTNLRESRFLTLTCKYSLTFLLVNFFTKMNIARTPEGFQVPGVAEMNPTGLPQLFRHLSNLNNSQKCEKMQLTFFKKKKQKN